MSAINKNESFAGSCAISMAGLIAPRIFPRCGMPVDCMPVSIRAMGGENRHTAFSKS